MIGFWLDVCSVHSPIQIMLSMHITGEFVCQKAGPIAGESLSWNNYFRNLGSLL